MVGALFPCPVESLMVVNERRIRDPVERYVGTVLGYRYPSATIVYESGLRSVEGGGFVSDFDFCLTEKPTVLIEVTTSGKFDLYPKSRQRGKMEKFVKGQEKGSFEFAVLFLQNLIDIKSTNLSLNILEQLAQGVFDSYTAESLLLNHVNNYPLTIKDKNALHMDWGKQAKLFLSQ